MMPRPVIGVGVLLVSTLALRTFHEAARWQSDQSLWCSAVSLAPDRPRVLNNCAGALMKLGASDQALPLLEHAALEVERPARPDNRRIRQRQTIAVNRALALVAVHRPDEARAVFARVDPNFPGVARLAWLRPE